MVAAGFIGSVLTFAIVPFIDNPQEIIYAGLDTTDATDLDEPSTTVTAPPMTEDGATIADVVENAAQAIVGVVNVQELRGFHPSASSNGTVESGTGSGVIFKKEEEGTYIVTNQHVIEGASEIEVSLYNGEKASAELIGSDALTDIAVLRIDSEYDATPIAFGDSSKLRPGDTVLAIGNPLGLDLSRTVTQGIVSAIDRNITVTTSVGEWELDVIQTDAAINPGNSGGALINTQGEMVGINSLKIRERGVEGLGFAIPSKDFETIVNEIMETGKVNRPYMGVGLANLSEIPQFFLQQYSDDLEKGVIITNIDPGSAAADAGLQVEDIIIKIDDTEISSASDLRKYLYSKTKIGEEVTITVNRRGEEHSLPLTLTGQLENTN
ncbi:trypsin-like peptidase domain-containing protein [Bacillus tamaricis]|uniref:Trypsin-like peptidase domain-containing protein n=2 Tax=Evansella tamaricis TaxID=2069301 RepID=A0ABS6JFZ1_9BACI|nr:trypsin-like peptidase domain-containing protein [Evansella tamaricis]